MNNEHYCIIRTQAIGFLLERFDADYLVLEFADGITNVYNTHELESTTAALTISTFDIANQRSDTSLLDHYRDKVQGKLLPTSSTFNINPGFKHNHGGKRGVQVSTVRNLFLLLDYLRQQSEPISRKQMERDLGIYVTGLLTHHQTRLTLVSLNELELVRPVRVKMKHFDRENVRKRLYELTAKGRESGKEILETVYSKQCAILNTTEH